LDSQTEIKTVTGKTFFVALLKGEEMKASQQAFRPMKRVSLTVSEPIKKTPYISRKELLSFKFLSNFEEKELEK